MEVKKKVVSMMLALTLVFSEIPAYTANAAENPSDNVEEDGTETKIMHRHNLQTPRTQK